MTGFRAGHGASGEWEVAIAMALSSLGEPPPGANLGFLYATDNLAAHMGDMVEALRRRTGIAAWTGTVGFGICAQTDDGAAEYFDRPAVAILAAALPADAFRLLPLMRGDTGEMGSALQTWLRGAAPAFGVVHGDPNNGDVARLVGELAADDGPFLVGGLTASRAEQAQVAGDLVKGGLSGVLFDSTVSVATSLSQGCSPLGAAHLVTKCSDNVLIALDGRPALEVFKEDIGELLARDLRRVAGLVHAALPVVGSDIADYTVRNLVAIDPDQGWLAIGDTVDPGDRVLFVRRDPASARKDLERMLDRLHDRTGETSRAGLYYSCVARGPNIFGRIGDETAMVKRIFPSMPLVGFFGNGEISRDRVYGYTGVLSVFTEAT